MTSFFTAADMFCRNIPGIYEEQSTLCNTLQQIDNAEDIIAEEEKRQLEKMRRNAKIAGLAAGAITTTVLAGGFYLIFRDKATPGFWYNPTEEQIAHYQMESLKGFSFTAMFLTPIMGGVGYIAYYAQKELQITTDKDTSRNDRIGGKMVSIRARIRQVDDNTPEHRQLKVARDFFKSKVNRFNSKIYVEIT